MKQKQINIKMFIVKALLLSTLLLSMPCHAQYQEKHEVSFFIGGGYSTLIYYLHDIPNGKINSWYGGNSGLGYSYFFNDFLGIGTGVEIGYYNTKVAIEQFSDKYPAFDGEENFEFRYDVNGYKEKQSLFSVNIPLMVQLQLPLLHDEHLCYLALGGRIGFPFRSFYNSSSASYKTAAYYPQYDVLLESPASQGLGIFNNRKSKDDLKFQTLYMLSAEAGMKWMISDNFSLYTGIYCDYSFINAYENKQYESFLKYSQKDPASLPSQSILKSQHHQNNISDSFASRVFPATLGVKIRLAFRIPDKGSCCF